jgi:DNA-binding FrmR family transcriptional regulator
MRQLYPDHASQLARLNKIEGQVKGIRRMIESHRPCLEIVQQLRAVTAALEQVKLGLLEAHVLRCAADLARSGNRNQLEQTIEDVIRALAKVG